jgi:hypothetical protein
VDGVIVSDDCTPSSGTQSPTEQSDAP